MFGLIGKLAGNGVVGLNERNCQYIMRYTPRRLYPLVDDKLATKRLAMAAGLPVPELYGVIGSHREVRDLPTILAAHRDFVVKPAQGSGGDGILVVSARVKDRNVYRLVDGQLSRTSVKIGLANYDRAELVDGISAGELVAVPSGDVEFADGLAVTADVVSWP